MVTNYWAQIDEAVKRQVDLEGSGLEIELFNGTTHRIKFRIAETQQIVKVYQDLDQARYALDISVDFSKDGRVRGQLEYVEVMPDVRVPGSGLFLGYDANQKQHFTYTTKRNRSGIAVSKRRAGAFNTEQQDGKLIKDLAEHVVALLRGETTNTELSQYRLTTAVTAPR